MSLKSPPLLKKILLVASIFGASQAQTECFLCPDGTNDITSPDREIPYVNIVGSEDTCAALLELTDDPQDCASLQEDAGYCGCANVEKIDACSLCPGGADPPDADRRVGGETVSGVTTGGELCGDIALAVSFFSAERCEVNKFKIAADSYRCGCPNAPTPQCPLCREEDEADCNLSACSGELYNTIPATEKDQECFYFCNGRFSGSASFNDGESQNCRYTEGTDLGPVWGCTFINERSLATRMSTALGVISLAAATSALALL